MNIPDGAPFDSGTGRPAQPYAPKGESPPFSDIRDVYTKGEQPSERALPRDTRTSDGKTHAHLADLKARGIDSSVIIKIEKDLDWRGNEDLLRSRIAALPNHGDSMRKALDIAVLAHRGQTQKRPQDSEGLDNIPYSNHPVQVANMAFEKKLPWYVVEAAILHDVVEDTSITLDDLRREGFDEKTVALVLAVSRKPDETRAAYMERVGKMKGYPKLLKCLDRYQNMLRSFSVRDTSYLGRYTDEAETYYVPSFYSLPELSDMKDTFNLLLTEAKKFRITLIG
jgi:hypothetical protein